MIIKDVSTTLEKKCMTIAMELLVIDRSYSLELVMLISSYKIECSSSPEEVGVAGIVIGIVMGDSLVMTGREVSASFENDFTGTAAVTERDDRDCSEVGDSSFAVAFRRTPAYRGVVFLRSYLSPDNLPKASSAVGLSLIHNRNHPFHDLCYSLYH
jgi:hypothetical protein